MAIKSDYISGTLTITQGSIFFTGTGTGWRSAEFKEGDTLIDITGATEYLGVIESITGEATGTLTKAWEGPSLVNVPYRMRYQPDGARSTAQARNLIEILGNGNITAFALLNGASNLIPMFTGPGAMTLVTRQALVSGAAYDVQVSNLAGRAAYDGQDQGYAVLVSNIGDGRAAIYSKNSATSGDWSDPAYVTGAVGQIVQIEAGTTTTLPTGQDATLVVRPIINGYALDFGIPRGLVGANGEDGDTGPTGPRGEGLQIGATGTLAERSEYDSEDEGFSFVDVESGNLYFRVDGPGNWSDPIPFGKGDKGDPGDSGATIVTTNGVGNGTSGPYTLNEAPASLSATWASISGVTQYDFTLSGNQITFGIPISSGISWQVKSSGVLSVVTPADGSVGASKINTAEATGIRTAINAALKPATAVTGNLAVFNSNREVVDTGIAKATTVQAQAGTSDTNYMTPLKTAQAILALSPPTDVSGLYSSVSALALSLADLQGSRLVMNGGVADAFDDETGISANRTAYTNTGGTGNRTSTITVTSTYTADAGTAPQLVDGVTTGSTGYNWSIQSNVGKYLQFDFGSAVIIEEFKFYQTSTIGHGVMRWEASNTAGSGYVIISDNFTLGGALQQTQLISTTNQILYRYWRLVGVSGSVQNSPWLQEFEFKIGTITGSSSNQVYDAVLDLYNPSTGTLPRLSSGTPSSPNFGGTPANFNDNDPATIFTTGGLGTLNTATLLQRIVARIDFGSVVPVTRVEVKQLRASSGIGASDALYISDDGVTYTILGEAFSVSSSTVDIIRTSSVTARYVALVSGQNSWGTITWSMQDINVFTVASSLNMTLVSIPYPATSIPTQGRLVVQIDSSLTLIAGTDFDGAISRDGGTTWVTMPLTLTSTIGNIKTYESLSLVNFTGPNGSSLLFRIRTLTNKNIPVSGVVMQWK